METRRRAVREDGRRRREAILVKAVELAAVDGLEGLSIGNLAAALQMSKSGVYAHFGSKEELQLATVARASQAFSTEVVEPALARPAGLARVVAFCDAYLERLRGRDLPGGCFFAAATLEEGPRRGPVKHVVARHQREVWSLVHGFLTEARAGGELPDSEDLDELMLELQGVLLAANARYVVEGEDAVLGLAAKIVRRRLGVPGGPGGTSPEV